MDSSHFCIGLEKKSLILTHEFTINLLLTNSPQLRVLFVPKQNYLPPAKFTDNHATSFSKSFSQVVQFSNQVKILLLFLQTQNIHMKQILKANYLQKFKT